MRYLLFIVPILIASCSSTSPKPFEELSMEEREELRKELLDDIESQAIEHMDEACEFYNSIECFPPNRIALIGLEIKTNFEGEILLSGSPSDTSQIAHEVVRYYTINKDLGEAQIERMISDLAYEGYNYPFYTYISLSELNSIISREKEDLEHAKNNDSEDLVEFHQKAINDWEEKLRVLKILGTETLHEIHQQTHIIIDSHDSIGFTDIGRKAVYGLCQVRGIASQEYFDCSYLELYYNYKITGKAIYKNKLFAIDYLYKAKIFDVSYLNSIDCEIPDINYHWDAPEEPIIVEVPPTNDF